MQEIKHHCPYCGESVHLIADEEMLDEPYIEDCEVCCRPIVITLFEHGGELQAMLKTENDV